MMCSLARQAFIRRADARVKGQRTPPRTFVSNPRPTESVGRRAWVRSIAEGMRYYMPCQASLVMLISSRYAT
eukprot:49993-Eustigmatos_ZCMA.PRE.2